MLGPLLLLIYINDLEINIKSSMKFFADDTMLYSIVYGEGLSALELNHDLQRIKECVHPGKMAFNPDPNTSCRNVMFTKEK